MSDDKLTLTVKDREVVVPPEALWTSEDGARVISSRWLRRAFVELYPEAVFGSASFTMTPMARTDIHVLCTVPLTLGSRTVYGYGEAWERNLVKPISRAYPARMALRRAESDAILTVVGLADRVYTDDQIEATHSNRVATPPTPEATPSSADTPSSSADPQSVTDTSSPQGDDNTWDSVRMILPGAPKSIRGRSLVEVEAILKDPKVSKDTRQQIWDHIKTVTQRPCPQEPEAARTWNALKRLHNEIIKRTQSRNSHQGATA